MISWNKFISHVMMEEINIMGTVIEITVDRDEEKIQDQKIEIYAKLQDKIVLIRHEMKEEVAKNL